MFIGRIICKNSNNIQFHSDYINIIGYSNDTVIKNDIPILIIGKELSETIFGKDKIKVLDRKIDKNLFWTYSKMEKRSEYENDLLKFNKYIINNVRNSCKYLNFNIFIEPLHRIKSFIKFIDNNYNKIIYYNNNHLYIYTPGSTSCIVGLSLSDCEYIGINKDKILQRIKKNKSNIFIEDDNFMTKSLKKEFNNSKYIIPYLYFVLKS